VSRTPDILLLLSLSLALAGCGDDGGDSQVRLETLVGSTDPCVFVGEPCRVRPFGIVPAPDGSTYFTDLAEHRIARVDRAGRVRTIVDAETVGSCGDTGPRRDACLSNTTAVVRDTDGTLYFVDRGTEEIDDPESTPGRVRRLDPATGVVTTIAGNCTAFEPTTVALDTCFILPSVLLLDGTGGLLVGSDGSLDRIDLATGTIRNIVGGGLRTEKCADDGISAVNSCTGADDVARDAAGNLYVIDGIGDRVRRIDAATGLMDTVAGGASILDCSDDDGVPATSACLSPTAIAVEGTRLVINSAGGFRIVDLETGLLHTVPGSPGPADCGEVTRLPSRCLFAFDMAFDAHGRLLVSDNVRGSVRRVTLPRSDQ
jgi:hypothetical protein